jgi:hypothetical protein
MKNLKNEFDQTFSKTEKIISIVILGLLIYTIGHFISNGKYFMALFALGGIALSSWATYKFIQNKS